jgi:hypothetical protein
MQSFDRPSPAHMHEPLLVSECRHLIAVLSTVQFPQCSFRKMVARMSGPCLVTSSGAYLAARMIGL